MEADKRIQPDAAILGLEVSLQMYLGKIMALRLLRWVSPSLGVVLLGLIAKHSDGIMLAVKLEWSTSYV